MPTEHEGRGSAPIARSYRGRQSKESITIRVDSDVLGWFKSQGNGYQTRMNQVLRRYMEVAGQRAKPIDGMRRKGTGRREARTSKRAR